MADNRAEIVLDGDVSPLRQKLREASNGLKQFGTDGEQAMGRMTGPLKMLQERFVAIGALLAGGAIFSEAVAQTVEFTEESTKLARALGVSASEASVLREALIAGNTSQDEFLGAAKGLARQLRENESALQGMGLQTRDAAGELRPLNDLVLEGIEVVNGYRAGTDRAIAGQAMFGKGFEMSSSLAEMNKEAVAQVAEQMQELGMVASTESVAAWAAYDDATDRAGITLKALKTTIGNAVMPVLSKLADWFSAIGPAAVVVLRGAIGGLISLFWGLKTAAGIAFEVLNAGIITVAEPFRAFAVAVWKLLNGDINGAREEMMNIPKVWTNTWDKAWDTMVKDAADARDQIWNLFSQGTPTEVLKGGSKSAGGLVKPDKPEREKKDPSRMAEYEAELAAAKNKFEQENLLLQYSKEQELAFWRERLANHAQGTQDWLAISKRAATLELEIRRKVAKDQRDLDAVMADHRRAEALAHIALEEQAARFAQENGTITKAELLAQEQEFARRRFEVEAQAVQDRLALAQTDPATSPAELARIKEQLLEVERQYNLRRNELMQQAMTESGAMWRSFSETISGLWDKGVSALMNGTFTWRNAFRAVATELTAWFTTEVVGKQVREWAAGQAKMLAVKLGFLAKEQVAQTAASATTVAVKGAEATAVVASNAVEAGTGAAASQAQIPIVGPALAIAAMAGMFAAVMAMGARKSAAGGYDIPRGLNPLTQLHEEEMVLPKQYANVIRGLAGQGGADGGAGAAEPAMNVTIQAWDSRDVRRFLNDNGAALAEALRKQGRNFSH